MSTYARQIEAAIRSTAFLSPVTYAWSGVQSPQLLKAVECALTPEDSRALLIHTLQSQLYRDFYCPGTATKSSANKVEARIRSKTPFAQQLSAANEGKGYWQADWHIRAVEGKILVASKEGLELRVQPGMYMPGDGANADGMKVSIRFPKEFLGMSPGYYMALGEASPTEENAPPLVRFYWNLSAPGAVPLVRLITSQLNRSSLRFRLKVLNDPNVFSRCDAAVLYVSKHQYEAVSQVLARIYPQIAGHLKPPTPAFTKQLAPGLGLAEDPGGTESFGQHRCRLLAEGLVFAYETNKVSVQERLQVVLDHFAQAGIDVETPYLNPGSSDDYTFEIQPQGLAQWLRSENGNNHRNVVDPEALLQTAVQIGECISQEAIWYEDRCNWLGAGLLETHSSTKYASRVYRALGPDLYDGTAGVALFLAELQVITGDTRIRRTARGAIAQALSQPEKVPAEHRLGLYSGWPGIALAATRVGLMLGEEELVASSERLMKRCASERLFEHDFDLLLGTAGAVVACLALYDALSAGYLLDYAVRLADELLAAADKDSSGYSWRSLSMKTRRNPLGLSHGAAGAGYALLELFRITGDARYRQVAEGAFAYERRWFDPEEGNWPDFRVLPGQTRLRKRGKEHLPFATYWCHGAPGIALSRLRAYEILGDAKYKEEAVPALNTTRNWVAAGLQSGLANYSLCHGLTGNAEVLLHGDGVLGEDEVRSELVQEVANTGIERYGENGSWPSGADGGYTPSLMLGLAGIGLFYLRLYNTSIPSVLLPHATVGKV